MTLRVSGVTRVPTFVGQGVAFVAMSLTLISPVSGQTAQEKQICVVPGPSDTAAIVNGDRITVAEVDAYLGVKLSRVRSEEYQLRARALDELIEKHSESTLIGPAHLVRGRAAYEAKSFDSAIPAFERAATAAPELADESAYWIAKWPRPPMPTTAMRAPGCGAARRMAAHTV